MQPECSSSSYTLKLHSTYLNSTLSQNMCKVQGLEALHVWCIPTCEFNTTSWENIGIIILVFMLLVYHSLANFMHFQRVKRQWRVELVFWSLRWFTPKPQSYSSSLTVHHHRYNSRSKATTTEIIQQKICKNTSQARQYVLIILDHIVARYDQQWYASYQVEMPPPLEQWVPGDILPIPLLIRVSGMPGIPCTYLWGRWLAGTPPVSPQIELVAHLDLPWQMRPTWVSLPIRMRSKFLFCKSQWTGNTCR